MGLTVRYDFKSRIKDGSKALKLVESMRQLAMDLPFENVGEIIDLSGEDADFENPKYKGQNVSEEMEGRRWLLIQASGTTYCPWNKGRCVRVTPSRVIAFNAYPGDGCEPMNIGLCLFPDEIDWEYDPKDDLKFHSKLKNARGFESTYFDWRKFDRSQSYSSKPFTIENRKVPTKLKGWTWGSFCKTQYASNPDCGGIANFLKCHVSVITLLDRIAKLKGMKVSYNDEGQYGSSNYSDDYEVARKEGREPTYVDHAGKYNIPELVREVGDWNGFIASFVGKMNDTLGRGIAPITDYPNFETLEFKGSQDGDIQPFLTAMDELAKETRVPETV